MSKQLVVHKGRFNSVTVNVGINLTGSTMTSEIRERADQASELIAEWDVTVDDEATGMLTLSMGSEVTGIITHTKGFMDIKRATGGDSVPVFDEPLAVEFRGTVTV